MSYIKSKKIKKSSIKATISETIVKVIGLIPGELGRVNLALFSGATVGVAYGVDPMWAYPAAGVAYVLYCMSRLLGRLFDLRDEQSETEKLFQNGLKNTKIGNKTGAEKP
jgi:hypothetical protein